MQFKKNFLALLSSIDGDTIKARDVARIAQSFEPVTSYGRKSYGTQWRVELKRGRCFPLPDYAVLNHREYNQRELLARLKEDFSVEPLRHIPPRFLDGASPLMREEYAQLVELCDASPFAAETLRQADEAGADLWSFRVTHTLRSIFKAHATTTAQHGKTALSETVERYAQAYIEGIRNPPRVYNPLLLQALNERNAAAFGRFDPERQGRALAIIHHKPNAKREDWTRSLRGFHADPETSTTTGKNPFELWLAFHRIDPNNVQPRERRKPPTTTRKGGAARRQEILALRLVDAAHRLTHNIRTIETIEAYVQRNGAETAISQSAKFIEKADELDGGKRGPRFQFLRDKHEETINALGN